MKHRNRCLLVTLTMCAGGIGAARIASAQPPRGVDVVPQPAPAERPAAGSVAEGVELTRRAQLTTDPTDRNAAIARAEEIYTNAIAADPQQGAALNNLAVLAVKKGDAAGARQYFERAIATDDGHKGLYALNYSKYLQTIDRPAAIQQARVAVAAAPDSALANEQLGRLLWQETPRELLPFAREVAARGNTELATRFALRCLRSRTRPADERRAWLILLAIRVAREYSLSEAVRAAMSHELATLDSDPEIGRGAAQLRAVIGAAPPRSEAVGWWAAQTSNAPLQSASGRVVMRGVLLAAGEFQASRSREQAELYYTAALDLGDRGPDPNAFLRLVDLYANTAADENDARRRLAKLMNRYQYELYTEKSSAYAAEDWPLVYRMHVALGMTYAYLDVWKSNVPYQNGIFQLSNAMVAAERANARSRTNSLALPAVGVEKLAQGYLAIGRPDLSMKTRIDGATALQKIGHTDDSKELFAQIDPAALRSLDSATQAQYEALRGVLQ